MTSSPILTLNTPRPTWEMAEFFPEQGAWREADYLAFRPNRHVEYTHGYIEVLPMPKQSHQLIFDFIYFALRTFVLAQQLGRILGAPLRVRLRPGLYREPDIVFMRTQNLGRCGEDYWEGADLVLEIVSPDERSRERDLLQKRREYAEANIPEYWIIDPQTETITVLHLVEAKYAVHGEFRMGDQVTSRLLVGFAVAVIDVFNAAKCG